ncbi:MAG: 50S ribosomal protein L21 [Candidatus Acetothermia bacterium]|nr:50S ribosomal protein L21 [Candidatus Acetothermia bacterium]MDH7506050.1 50S ribosomal protein L21 [Candidatus Acetothermia bacterium]
MYAVVETGGKQYLIEQGEELLIERLPQASPGATVRFEKVLLLSTEGKTKIGQPYVEGAEVVGRIIEEVRGEKLPVFTYKSKTRYRRKVGHRQHYMRAKIEEIQG